MGSACIRAWFVLCSGTRQVPYNLGYAERNTPLKCVPDVRQCRQDPTGRMIRLVGGAWCGQAATSSGTSSVSLAVVRHERVDCIAGEPGHLLTIFGEGSRFIRLR